jgi:hypothetical protein
MIRVISSPSSSTIAFLTLILLTRGDAIYAPLPGAPRICFTSRMATVSEAAREQAAPWQTHTVFNQAPPLENVDVFSSNLPLVEAVAREGAAWVAERAAALGRFVGGEPQQSWGRLANENRPVLRTHDRYGNRIDEVEFHPAWHALMKMGIENELHSLPWTSEEPFSHTARAALYMTAMQAEAGFCCPITMTFAVVPALRAQPELAAEWEPRLMARTYDPELRPAGEKASAIAGMAMTEKQGGSDVRANTTVAKPLNGGGAGEEYEIHGHSGSARRRCATSSSCSRRPRRGCRASSCRASCPTAAATRFTSSA